MNTTVMNFDENETGLGAFNECLYSPDSKIMFGNPNASTTIQGEKGIFFALLNQNSRYKLTENLLLEAIRNFIRKENIAELNQDLNDELINEEQYYEEIEKNEDKYTITLKEINNIKQIMLISRVVNKIGHDLKDFSTSDISEMFGIKEEQLRTLISKNY